MSKIKLFLFSSCFSFLLGSACTYNFHLTKNKQEVQKVINANYRIFEEIEKTFDLTISNSDVIMRLSHYTDGHSDKVIFCPECFNSPMNHDDNTKHQEHIDPISIDMNQLLKDSEEFRQTFQLINASLVNQEFSIKHALKQLKLKEGKND
jgi:hypothetical protein